MDKANVDFLSWAMNYNLTEREGQYRKVDLDESTIKSGDYFAVMRLDGLDPMIMYGTGSHSGHTVMALRFDGELYIVESQDAPYWPVARIQRNKFSQWIKMAEEAEFHVTYMPLSDEMREKFNETAAQEFFYRTQGLPYGFHNFLFSWIDTPDDNWPNLFPKHLAGPLFSVVETIDKNVTDIFFNQALNHHLGTKDLNLSSISMEADKRNMSLGDVMAVVEQDGWKYHGQWHDGESFVCSTYVAALWKAAGLFGNHTINAAEFSPRDVYQIKIFDDKYKDTRPERCKLADPDSPHCQILGKYRMEFPGFNSIEIYSHMNEKCPSVAPDFVRPDGC